MRRVRVLVALLVIAVVALTTAAVTPRASAQALSLGCNTVNSPALDGLYFFGLIAPATYFAGERITFTASPPTDFATTTTLALIVNGEVVDTAPFPGTLEYVIPATDEYVPIWTTGTNTGSTEGAVTWSASCRGAGDPEQALADLETLVSVLGLAHGLTTALNSKLEDALAALDADDTAGVCESLQAFLNQVRAQNGKKLSAAQAQQLSEAANNIRALLDC